jgi:hypothetical protein
MCGMPRCRACSGGFFEQQLPAGAQHAGDHGDGLLPLGHVVDDAEVDNGVVAGARLLDVADFAGRKRHSAPVQASARELDHGLVEVDRRHPSPTGTTCNSVSTTCAATSAAHRGLSNATTTTTSSASIDGTQGPKDGDVTRHIMVIDVNTEALELGSAPPAGSSGAHSSPRQTRPIRWPTTTG